MSNASDPTMGVSDDTEKRYTATDIQKERKLSLYTLLFGGVVGAIAGGVGTAIYLEDQRNRRGR